MNTVAFPVVACAVIITLAGCASPNAPAVSAAPTAPAAPAATTEAPDSESEPLSLSGKWKQSNSSAKDSWQAITIGKDAIEIYWVSDGGDTRSVYWIGSYLPPKTTEDAYQWISKRDKKKTDNAMLASTDPTKKFTYKDGVLSYQVSLMGTTKTVKAERV